MFDVAGLLGNAIGMPAASPSPAAPPPCDAFARALAGIGGRVHVVGDGDAVAAVVAEAAASEATERILFDPFPLARELELVRRLASRGVELVSVEQAGQEAAELRVGLTGAELGVAETGTLLVGGRPGGWGLASALPWVHVAVLRARDVVPDLAAAVGRFGARLAAGEGDWVWITGPSRTADIGKTLVLGAHGPNALEVCLVVGDGPGPAGSLDGEGS